MAQVKNNFLETYQGFHVQMYAARVTGTLTRFPSLPSE